LPASRARGAHLSANNSNRSLEQRTEISASIYGSWRGGITAIRARARIFFREKDWPYRRILRACSRLLARRRTKLKRIRNPARLNRPKERHEPNPPQKKNHTLRAEIWHAAPAEGHFRETQRLVLSSLGIGTYLGQPDTKTDEGYRAAAVAAVEKPAQCDRRRDQLPFSAQRAKYRCGAARILRRKVSQRGNRVVYQKAAT